MNQDKEVQKIQIIGPVNTNTDNPWRTLGDYREDQRQMRNAYRWAVGASVAAIITALCSTILAYSAFVEIKDISKEIRSAATQQPEKANDQK